MSKKNVKNEGVPVFIDGKTISLIPPNSDHVNLYFKWLNHSKVRKYARWELPVTTEDIKKWFEPQEGRVPHVIVFELWHKKDKKPIGEVGLSEIDWINGWANVFLFIGEPEYWGKKIATEGAKMIIEYAFNELNLKILQAGAAIENISSWSVSEKIGFKYRGKELDDFYLDGKYIEGKCYRLSKEDWLNSKKNID
jgi:RimJ/RimL family protein N-acetyltransferase